jgi:hypothetical protein
MRGDLAVLNCRRASDLLPMNNPGVSEATKRWNAYFKYLISLHDFSCQKCPPPLP